MVFCDHYFEVTGLIANLSPFFVTHAASQSSSKAKFQHKIKEKKRMQYVVTCHKVLRVEITILDPKHCIICSIQTAHCDANTSELKKLPQLTAGCYEINYRVYTIAVEISIAVLQKTDLRRCVCSHSVHHTWLAVSGLYYNARSGEGR